MTAGLLSDRKVRSAGAARLCRHCGVPLATDAAHDAGFCCAGCSYVFRLVHEHGLEGYYKIRDVVVPPVDSVVFQTRDYGWLVELQAVAEKEDEAAGAHGSSPAELTLEVQGISCAGCVWLIERLFHQQPGALAIETDAATGRVRLCWARGEFEAVAFARTLQGFNYLLGPPGQEPPMPESRLLVRRVGLSAAFSMNIMLFTLPAYFGMSSDFAYASLFGTLSMGFATLSVLTGGMYFLKRAVGALRERSLHIDLPIAVGIVGAYLGSLYGWLSGRETFIYFDFVGAFIFLMLTGRWAQVAAVERNRRRLLSASVRPDKVAVIMTDGSATDRAVEELRAGDVFMVRSGQVVPVEARLETATATLGTAWISGEADPRECRTGGRVPAGATNLGRSKIRLQALQGWSESLLARLLRPAERNGFRHRFLERVIGGYLVGIFVIASLAGSFWWLKTHDPARTWAVVTAVLVVSCPCAIGLAFPLTDEMATVVLRRCGIFVREADLWPRLARIRKIIFDKTGTLTLETPCLMNPEALAGFDESERAALLALVRDNAHPVSQCLLENLLAQEAIGTIPAGEVREQTGFGVSLETRAGAWTLGRPGWRGNGGATSPSLHRGMIEPGEGASPPENGEASDAEFCCDGVVRARFRLCDALRRDAVEEIAALRRRGLEIFILSGDRREKVQALARQLGISGTQAVAEASPLMKAAWLERLDERDTLMLGDGANDSLAFDAAFARGTPVIHRGVLAAKADFYYLGRNLAGLRRLFEVNEARRRTQAALLVFSVGYNLLAVGLAAAGRMNPLLAAILMPVSSLLTLAIVLGGMRGWLPERVRKPTNQG